MMNQRTVNHSDDLGRLVTVEMIARLASRYLTDEQLIDLLARLEHKLVTRAMLPTDRLLSERPAGA